MLLFFADLRTQFRGVIRGRLGVIWGSSGLHFWRLEELRNTFGLLLGADGRLRADFLTSTRDFLASTRPLWRPETIILLGGP